MFRSVNKLRGGLPDIKDALDLLQLKPERLTLQSPGVPPSGVSSRRLISWTRLVSPTPAVISLCLRVSIFDSSWFAHCTGGRTAVAKQLAHTPWPLHPKFGGALPRWDSPDCGGNARLAGQLCLGPTGHPLVGYQCSRKYRLRSVR